MKTRHILSLLTAGALLAPAPVALAEDAATPQQPAATPALPTIANVTEETAQAYLQAERQMLDMIDFDDEEAATENQPKLQAALAQFRKDFPRPLAAAAPKSGPCPAWLLAALKEEHAMLLELVEKSRSVSKAVRSQFPVLTQACYALHEPMLLSHVVLTGNERAVQKAYSLAPTLENAKAVLGGLELTEEDNFFYRIGFVYSIFKAYPDHMEELLDAVTAAGETSLGAGTISEALWLLNTDEAIAARMAWPSFITPAEGAQRPDFHHIENIANYADEAHLLDCAWGVYDATQDAEVLQSFIRCAVRTAGPENGVTLWAIPAGTPRDEIPAEIGDIIALTARWSVRSRAQQDPVFAAKVQDIVSKLTPEEQERFNAPLPERDVEEYQQN